MSPNKRRKQARFPQTCSSVRAPETDETPPSIRPKLPRIPKLSDRGLPPVQDINYRPVLTYYPEEVWDHVTPWHLRHPVLHNARVSDYGPASYDKGDSSSKWYKNLRQKVVNHNRHFQSSWLLHSRTSSTRRPSSHSMNRGGDRGDSHESHLSSQNSEPMCNNLLLQILLVLILMSGSPYKPLAATRG